MSYIVTIIIPSFNSEKFLNETINSLINQTIGFENIEVIIVDDYSTDNTLKIIENYCNNYENIKYYESGKKTGTPGRARNIGIKNSNADYIMFIDHDDLYVENTVEKLYNAITSNSADVAIGKYQNFGDNSIITEYWITEDTILNSIDENPLFFSINNIWRMIFPKKFLTENNIIFPEGVFAEDLVFMIQCFLNANKIVFINEVVYKFRLRSIGNTSTSLSKGKHYLGGLIEGYNYVYDAILKNNGEKYYDRISNQHLSCWISDLALSKTIEEKDKIQLLKKCAFFIEKMDKIEPFPTNNSLKNIMLTIKKDDLDSAFNQMHEFAFFTHRANELEDELNRKKQQIAILQTTKGWLKYKIKNILSRIKN